MSRDLKEYLSKDRLMRPIGVAAAEERGAVAEPDSAAAVVVPNPTPLTVAMPVAVGMKKKKAKTTSLSLRSSQPTQPEAVVVLVVDHFAAVSFVAVAVHNIPSTSTKKLATRQKIFRMAATPAMTKEALAEDVGEAAAEEEEEEAFVEAFGVDVAAFEAAFEEVSVLAAVAAAA